MPVGIRPLSLGQFLTSNRGWPPLLSNSAQPETFDCREAVYTRAVTRVRVHCTTRRPGPARVFHERRSGHERTRPRELPAATIPHHSSHQNVIFDRTARVYQVQERLQRAQAPDAAMQLVQERMAHLYVFPPPLIASGVRSGLTCVVCRLPRSCDHCWRV